MTVISRTIRSIPHRSAADTWKAIVELLAPSSGDARTELQAVAGTACALITEEQMDEYPIVLTGSGPRVRIYCLYDNEALEGDKASEGALPFQGTKGEWKLSLPSPEVDLAWVQKALKSKSSRITARKQDENVEDKATESSSSSLVVDTEALKKL